MERKRKDNNRAYIGHRHGQEWTQYLGAKSSTVGRVKLYNKQTEAHLNYPLTRLELTLDPSTPYSSIHFPEVYYLDDLQLCISEYQSGGVPGGRPEHFRVRSKERRR